MSAKKHTNSAYISHVHLKGYKSIIDTEVELHPGLNIIIGPNGSGKTNFLEFLHKISSAQPNKIESEFEVKLKFYFKNKNNEYTYSVKKELEVNDKTKKIEKKLKEKLVGGEQDIDSEREPDKSVNFFPIPNGFPDWKDLDSIIIRFGLPIKMQNLSQSLSFTVRVLNIGGDTNFTYTSYEFSPKITSGIEKILKDISSSIVYKKNDISINSDLSFDEVKRNLKKFTPIKSVRIMPKLDLAKVNSYYRADYVNFEFSVENNWLKWNQLSDGTKRLFYIISEVTLNDGLCLIEEPEIGVHPNQYDKILNFLKEQAEEKQIIITTHSPRTLDILEDEELDRIILTRYDRELGTKMRHLNEAEIKHAKNKEDGLFLSDLWTWTSFFDEEETVI